jgi:hypothetical protein
MQHANISRARARSITTTHCMRCSSRFRRRGYRSSRSKKQLRHMPLSEPPNEFRMSTSWESAYHPAHPVAIVLESSNSFSSQLLIRVSVDLEKQRCTSRCSRGFRPVSERVALVYLLVTAHSASS